MHRASQAAETRYDSRSLAGRIALQAAALAELVQVSNAHAAQAMASRAAWARGRLDGADDGALAEVPFCTAFEF